MRSGDIALKLKPDEKMKKRLKLRDERANNPSGKLPSELKSEAMRKRLDRRQP